MPSQCSELTMISSLPIQLFSVPESVTGCDGPKLSGTGTFDGSR